MTARPCSSATAAWCAIAFEQRALVVGERRVAVADELADLAALPRSGRRTCVRPGAALRPGDLAVLEHERGAGRADRVDRRLHDRLERLLQVQRLGDGLRDLSPAPRARARGAAPRRRASRARSTARPGTRSPRAGRSRPRCTRAAARVRTLSAPSSVSRARIGTARIDSYSSSGRFGNCLKRGVEMRRRGDHDRRALGRRRARDPLAGPHPRPPRHLLDARPVRRAQHELVGALVVEVDEARVGPERLRDLARDEREHLLEVERRVDRGDRLGQQPQVARGRVHRQSVGRRLSDGLYKLLTEVMRETSNGGE